MLATRTQHVPLSEARGIMLGAALISALLSLWVIISDDLINNDGILYLNAAELYLQGQWREAVSLYPWPAFPAMVATTSAISGLGLEASAQLLSTLFLAGMVYGFIGLVHDLGAGRNTLLLAAFSILCLPYINESRADIVRDHGYWAFYVASLWAFVRFQRKLDWRDAIWWNIAAAMAILFRVQHLFIAPILSLLLLLLHDFPLAQRIRALLLANALPLTVLAVAGLAMALHPALHPSQLPLGEIGVRFELLLEQFTHGMQARADAVSTAFLAPYADDYAMTVVVAALLIILIDKFIGGLTLVFALLLIIPKLRAAITIPREALRVLGLAVLLNVAFLLSHLITHIHLSTRYLIPLVLTVLPAVGYVLGAVFEAWRLRAVQSKGIRLLYPLLALWIGVLTIDGLTSTSASKAYIKQAGQWLRDNAEPGARIFTSNLRLDYYAGVPLDWGFRTATEIVDRVLPDDNIADYDYLAVQVPRRLAVTERERLAASGLQAITVFENERGDAVYIYRPPAAEALPGR